MIDIGFGYREEFQHIEMSYAAHYVYDLGTAKGLGLEEQGCDWDMGVYEAVLVDYNSAVLTMSLIDLAEHGCVTRAEVSVPELGENAVIGGSVVRIVFSQQFLRRIYFEMPCLSQAI
jgi:hypothetical protein